MEPTSAPKEISDELAIKSSSLESSKQSLESEEFCDSSKQEPSEETTDKSDIVEAKNYTNEDNMDTMEDLTNLTEHESIDMMEEKLFRANERSEDNEKSDNRKQENQDAGVASIAANSDDDFGEEVDSRDDENDKGSEGKSQSNDQDNRESSSQIDESASLGRNRRVRQKNRYFLDFHCIDLTKGVRSNKGEYETSTTSTRTSNRRSNDSSCSQLPEDPARLETKYCRKCLTRAVHGEDGGCQVCLYNRIVESYKRHKPSGQRSQRSRSKQHDNNSESSTKNTATSGSKRKVTKQSGSRNHSRNNNSSSNSSNNNDNHSDNLNEQSVEGTVSHRTDEFIQQTNSANASKPLDIVNDVKLENPDVVDGCNSTPPSAAAAAFIIDDKSTVVDNDFPKPDSWTPDEVAEYIMSKGFSQEAESFKSQSVDGVSLLLMQRTDFTYGLKIKLGPALKIYDQVCKLKKEYFKTVTAAN